MKLFLSNRWFLLLLRCVLAAVFIYAGALKTMAPQNFADSIASFQILPPFLLSIAALALPPFEILVGCLLLIGRFKRQAASSILALTVVFLVVLLQALIRGLEVDCGCFGSYQSGIWSASLSLARNLFILGSCGWLCCSEKMLTLRSNIESRKCKIDSYLPGTASAGKM